MKPIENPSDQRDVDVLRRLIFGRATCRAYLPEQVPRDVIRSIVDVARGTASWCNVQPWDLVITSGGSPFGPGRQSRTAQAQDATGLGAPFSSTRHMRQLPAIDSRSWKQKRGISAPAASQA